MKKTILITLSIGLIFILAASMALAFGFNGRFRGPANNAITQAIAAGDYIAYENAIDSNNSTRGPKKLTETQFNNLVEHYNKMNQSRSEFLAQYQKITDAIKNNDFNAWKDAITSQLTQESFDTIVARYNSRNETDMHGRFMGKSLMHKFARHG